VRATIAPLCLHINLFRVILSSFVPGLPVCKAAFKQNELQMITKYRTQVPPQHPFGELMSGLFNRDIGQLIGQDEPTLTKPRVNITETPEAFHITLSVPGFSKEQLKISTENETLTIGGEHNEEALAEKERFTRREFKTTSFS